MRTEGNFEVDFDVWSKTNVCAAADIREGIGRQVWGVLYEIPEFLIEHKTGKARGRKALDAIEGELYRRRPIAVQRPDGTRVDGPVITYTVSSPGVMLQTSLDRKKRERLARNRTIAINPVNPMPHKTRFHELAHVLLGHTSEGTMNDGELTPRNLREVEAESVALLCSAPKVVSEAILAPVRGLPVREAARRLGVSAPRRIGG